MGIFNRSIPTIQPNRQNQLQVVPQQTPYIDDIFDPILNAEVRKYLLDKYGNPISATLGGYAEGIDNALLGQDDKWGVLGSGMGILSGFGRSMDKAGDVIIGGLTEGVKGLTGQGMESPFYNTFVEDEDYSGGRLLAAMGNSMAGLAKAPKLTEQDFTGLWNIPSMGLELMTDPGIMGGMISKAAKPINLTEQIAGQTSNPKLAKVGKLLQDYDDFMAKVSIDMTAPGLRQGAKSLLNKIHQALGTSSNIEYANMTFNKNATPEERFASQDALRKTSNNMQYHDMYNEVSNVASNLPEESTLSSVDSAQVALGVGTTVPSAIKEEFDKRAASVADRPVTGYDQEIYRWLVDENQLTESQALLVMKAMDANLDELIAAENLERTSNLELEDAIRLATDKDLYTKSAKARAFFEDPWVKENIKNTNPNLYADLPDTFTLDDLDFDDRAENAEVYLLRYLQSQGIPFATLNPEEYAAFRTFFKKGSLNARNDLFNKIHNFAKQQWELTIPGSAKTGGLEFGDAMPTKDAPFYIDERELENVLPRILAEKAPDEALGEYKVYLNRLRNAYDMNNESARNAVLRGIGIDPKARTVRNIQKTPVTLSPSEFTGRSDTAVKLQVQYSHKRLTDFVKKYDINSFEDSPEFIRVFPNPKVRSEIKAKLEELLNFEAFTETKPNGNVSSNTVEYFKKVKEFSDYVIDRFKPVENVDLSSELNSFRLPSGGLDTYKLLDAFDSEEMFIKVASQVLKRTSLDDIDTLISKMNELSKRGLSYEEVKDMVKAKETLSYSKLRKTKNLSLLTPIRELNLTSKDFEDYDAILNALSKTKDKAVLAFYEEVPETSRIAEDIVDLAEGLQRNVVQPHEFRSGAIREHSPLPNKFWEAQDSYSDGTAERWAENEVTVGTKTADSKNSRGNRNSRPGKYLTTSANTDDTFNFHSTINNLIRVNPEAFATPEGRKILQKYFGDSFQVKIHGDYGILDGVSKDAIKAYKDEVLPLIENILERGYSPYVEITKSVSDDLLKNPKYKGSDGYKLRALMGKVPGVKASPHASAFKLIMDETVVHSDDLPYKLANDSKYVTPADVMLFKQSGGLSVKNSMSPYMYDYLLYNLQSKGVKDPENLLTSFFKGDSLKISDWRILNAAFQDIDVGTVTKDPRLNYIFKNAEDLARSKELHIQNFKDAIPYAYKKANEYILNSGKYMSNSPKYLAAVERKAIGDIITEFFGRNASLNEYYYKEIQSKIDYFKKIPFENVDLNDVVKYFIQHPDEYVPNGYSSSVVSQLAQYHPNYLQFRRRFYKNKAPLKQIGWIDYSKLYGKGEADLWANIVNKTEVQSPWRDPITYAPATSPKNAVEKAIAPSPATVKITDESAAQIENSVLANISEAPADESAELIANMPTPAEAIENQIIEELVPNHAEISKIAEPQGEIPNGSSPKPDPAEVVTEKEYTLYNLIHKSMAAVSSARNRDRATLRTDFVKKILDDAGSLAKHGVYEEDIAKYQRAQIYLSGAKVSKEEFLDTLASSGMIEMAFKDAAEAEAMLKVLNHNAAVVNVAAKGNVLKTFKHVLPNGNIATGIMFDTSNKNIVRMLEKNLKNINTNALMDIVRLDPGSISESVSEYLGSEKYRIIDEFFDRVRQAEGEYAKVLGFKYDDTRHVKNVMNISPDVAEHYVKYLYKDIDIHNLDAISEQFMASPAFKHLRGAWGSRKFDKRLLGYAEDFEDAEIGSLFSHNATQIVKGSLGEGSFNNSKFQLYVDLFQNDNFKINSFVSDVSQLEELFNARLADGTLSGNMQNLILAAPRFDNTGRIIGFTQFDKTTRAGLEQALKNKDTVLLPAHVFAPLDKVLRKDAAMSNKVYAFISKHLTTPFKFGVLMNPGFLIGNANDAYLKQATTMAHKYGTSVPEELANVAASIRDVMVLNNEFDNAYRKVLTHIAAEGFTLAPTHHISELAASDPRIRKMLKDYVSNKLQKSKVSPIITCRLSEDEILTIRTWLTLNSSSTTASFAAGLQDMDVIAKAKNSNAYAPNPNVVDRVLMGKGEYVSDDISTWGLMVNNPIARKFMDVSESTENLFRSAAILNDFRHKGLGTEYFKEYFNAKGSAKFKSKIMEDFDVNLSEAINTMHNANFDYERMTDFTDTVGKFVPFPTFFLKNLGYWLDVFVNHPQYIDHAITVQENLWNGKDTSEDEFAAEAKGRGAIPISTGQNMSTMFRGLFKPTPLQSMFGAFSLINNPVEDMYYRLHPLLSGGITAVSQLPPLRGIAADVLPQEDIKYRPYSTDMYERNVKLGDPNFNTLEYTLHRLNPVERTVQNAIRLPDKLEQDKAQLSDFLPSIFQPDF